MLIDFSYHSILGSIVIKQENVSTHTPAGRKAQGGTPTLPAVWDSFAPITIEIGLV